MATSRNAQPHALIPPNPRMPVTSGPQSTAPTTFGDPQNGANNNGDPISQQLLQLLGQWRDSFNGMCPLVPCNVNFTSNLLTLTPISVSPVLREYTSYWGFGFLAPSSSTGLVTATVAPPSGAMATLKVYGNTGSQINTGGIVSGVFYVLYYVDEYDSGVGGFALK